jgi:hypothetical protein
MQQRCRGTTRADNMDTRPTDEFLDVILEFGSGDGRTQESARTRSAQGVRLASWSNSLPAVVVFCCHHATSGKAPAASRRVSVPLVEDPLERSGRGFATRPPQESGSSAEHLTLRQRVQAKQSGKGIRAHRCEPTTIAVGCRGNGFYIFKQPSAQASVDSVNDRRQHRATPPDIAPAKLRRHRVAWRLPGHLVAVLARCTRERQTTRWMMIKYSTANGCAMYSALLQPQKRGNVACVAVVLRLDSQLI